MDAALLRALPSTDIRPRVPYRSCAVVGSSGAVLSYENGKGLSLTRLSSSLPFPSLLFCSVHSFHYIAFYCIPFFHFHPKAPSLVAVCISRYHCGDQACTLSLTPEAPET